MKIKTRMYYSPLYIRRLYKIWYKIRSLLVKLKLLKPLPIEWYWYELPSKIYVNTNSVRVTEKR